MTHKILETLHKTIILYDLDGKNSVIEKMRSLLISEGKVQRILILEGEKTNIEN